MPDNYLVGKALARDLVNKDTGEVIAPANSELTDTRLAAFRKAGVKEFKVLYVNDLDKGPYVSTTLMIDPTRTRLEALVEIYRMMRPGEPPTKDAAETLFNGLFFSGEKYDLSAVGRMKFNRRLRKESMTGCRTSPPGTCASSWARAPTSSTWCARSSRSATAKTSPTTSTTSATGACARSAR